MNDTSMKEILKKSLKYTISNKKAILTLGILFVLSHVSLTDYFEDSLILTIIIIYALILSAGYLTYIVSEIVISETGDGKFSNKEIIIHAFEESFIYLFYSAVILGLYFLFQVLTAIIPNLDTFLESLQEFIFIFTYLLPTVAIINIALHKGKIRKGFDIKENLKLILNMKTSKFICVLILSLLVENLIESIQINLASIEIGIPSIILNLIIIPTFILFGQIMITLCIMDSKEKIENNS